MVPLRTAAIALGLLASQLVSGPVSAQMTSPHPIDQTRPDAPELAAFGAQAIGVRTLTFTHADQIDILGVTDTETPVYDRPLTVEVWYPAADGNAAGTTYDTVIRDGTTPTVLSGRASRDADAATEGRFPLVIISHFPSHIFKCLYGCLVADAGVTALAVVEDLDVFKDCGLSLGSGSELLAMDQFLFQ